MENFGFSNMPDEPDILSGYFNGLFPNISTESSILSSYTETHQPSEPVLEDSLTYTFYIPRKPTNTWTNISQLSINCGFKFEKKHTDNDGKSSWVGVKKQDNAVPLSGLIQAFWSDVDIRLNQQRVTNNRHNSQMTSILSKLTTSHYYSSTLGRLSGVADDTKNPDIFSVENVGVDLRKEMYCIKDSDPDTQSAKVLNLRGPLYSNISSNPWPIPSEIDIYLSMTRNKNEVLITQTDSQNEIKSDTFRINLEYLEIIVPRLIIDPSIHNAIEKELVKKPIEMVYNRLEMRTFVIGPGCLSFDSGSLFQGYDIVRIFILYLIIFILYSNLF